MSQALLAAVFLSLLPLSASAKSTTVVQLQRVNYKEEKRLVYDLNYDENTCEIRTKAPFDAYYRENSSGQRLEKFSSESTRYFGPRLEGARLTPSEVPLHFQALREIQDKLGIRAQILVRLEKDGERCVPSAEITYKNQRFTLEKIFIRMKKALGIPTGVEWVLVTGKREDGSAVKDCVAGDCE